MDDRLFKYFDGLCEIRIYTKYLVTYIFSLVLKFETNIIMIIGSCHSPNEILEGFVQDNIITCTWYIKFIEGEVSLLLFCNSWFIFNNNEIILFDDRF